MIFSKVILLACIVDLGRCVTLELYSGQQYSGFLKKITLDRYDERECTKFDKTYEVRSLKTDKCVIIYETEDCKRIDANAPADWKRYSVRVEGNTEVFNISQEYLSRKEERAVQSFHACNRHLGGGSTLDIDIYDSPTYTGDLLASYGGVCECKNIPTNIVTKGKYLSVDNHGNSIYFYDKEDCTGLERLITAGDNERSRSVFQFDARAEVIRSFRPVDSLSCPPNLDVKVETFRFFNGTKMGGITEDDRKHIFTTTVINRKPFAATVQFNTSIPATVKYSVAKAFTYVHTTTIIRPEERELEMEFSEGLTLLLGGNTEALKKSIEANYHYTNTQQSTVTIDAAIPMQDQGSIDMDACKICELTYFARRFPISYTADGLVTGNDKMSQAQLRDLLPPGMKFIDNLLDYIFIVRVEAEMKADLLFRDHTKTFCKPAPNC